MSILQMMVAIVSAAVHASTFMHDLPIGTPVGAMETAGGFLVAGSLVDECVVMKLDPDGSLVWEEEYSFPGGDPESITSLSDGGYLLAGTKNLGEGDEAFLIRIDSEGQVVWDAALGMGISSHVYDCVETTSGTIAVCGNVCNAQWPDGEGFVALVSMEGSMTGFEVFDLEGHASALSDITAHEGGNLSVSGSVWGTISWTMLLDDELNVQWNSAPYEGGWSNTYECISAPGDLTAICGNQGYHIYSWNFMTVFDSEGQKVYDAGYSSNPPSDVPYLCSVDNIDTGGFCISGLALGECVLFRVGEDCTEIWRTYYPGIGLGQSVTSCSDAGFLILASHSISSSWVLKTDDAGSIGTTGIEGGEVSTTDQEFDISLSSNPLSSSELPVFTVTQGSGSVDLSIFDASGRVVEAFNIDENLRGTAIVPDDIETGLYPGVYLVHARSAQGTSSCRLVILPVSS